MNKVYFTEYADQYNDFEFQKAIPVCFLELNIKDYLYFYVYF